MIGIELRKRCPKTAPLVDDVFKCGGENGERHRDPEQSLYEYSVMDLVTQPCHRRCRSKSLGLKLGSLQESLASLFRERETKIGWPRLA
jgi:hypothetical protein